MEVAQPGADAMNGEAVAGSEHLSHMHQQQLQGPGSAFCPPLLHEVAASNGGILHDPLDPQRMELTEEEREWALDVKEAIESDPELDNVSDFMVAQLALVANGDVEMAIDRAHQMQALRQEYGIRDSFEQGVEAMTKFIDLVPGYLLSIHFNPHDGLYTIILDMPKFDKSLIWKRPGMMETYLTSVYYTLTALNPDFAAIRSGGTSIVETKGYEWGLNMMDMKTMRKVMTEVVSTYPARADTTRYYHTPMLFNIMLSLVRKFVPFRLRTTFEVGCQFPGGRLDSVYWTPNPEVAKERLVARITAILRERYDREKSFSLDTVS